MKILTNKDKLHIYKLALENFHEYTCMCPCIYDEIFKTDSTFREPIEVSYTKLFELLPEFLALKPKHKKACNYWWDPNNRSIRIKYFNKLIKELEAIQ